MYRLYTLICSIFLLPYTYNAYCQKITIGKDGSRFETFENGYIKKYDRKGNILLEGKLTDTFKTGEWKYYKDKDKLHAIENYNMHKLEGPATYYFIGTNQLRSTGSYKNDKRDDEWKFYAKSSGYLYATIMYKEGKVHGPAIYYDTIFDGHKISEGLHDNGKRVGKWHFYSKRSGIPDGIENYENGLMEGPAVYYDTLYRCGGDVCKKVAEGHYEKNLRVGVWTFYYSPSGKVRSTETYKDSIMHGPAMYYSYTTGKLGSSGNYNYGLPNGTWVYYDTTTGYKLFEIGYNNGEDTIIYEYFRDNRARIKSIQRSKNGLLHGDYEHFDSLSGAHREINHYEHNIRTGYISYHNGKEVLNITTKYKGDSCHVIKYDSICSKIISEGFFKDYDQKEGYIKYYFACSDRLSAIQNVKGERQYVKYFDSTYGTITTEGNGTMEKRYGEWKYYYPKSQRLYSTINYRNDLPDGAGRYYDTSNGKVLTEGYFRKGFRDGKWIGYNTKTDKTAAEESYKNGELEGKQIIYDTTGNVFCSYNYKSGKRSGKGLVNYYGTNIRFIDLNLKDDSLHGMLHSYYENGKLKREEKYENGKLLHSKCYASNGDIIDYYPIMIQPKFEEDVMTYIGRNLQYPQEARNNKAEGKVIVRFKILETGLVKDAEIIKSAGHGMDEEALRLVSQMPPWEPAYFDGVPYTTYKTLPIVFWLQDDHE